MEKIPFDGKTNCGIYLTLNIERSLFKKRKEKRNSQFPKYVHIYYYSRIIRGKEVSTYLVETLAENRARVYGE